MPIDIEGLAYEPVLVLPNADVMSLASVMQGLNWEEQPGELASRLTLQVANVETSSGKLHQDLSPGARLALRVDWGDGQRVLFLGVVEDWEYTDQGLETLTVTAYDDLFAFASSEDEYLVAAETPASDTLRQMLSDWGLTLGEFVAPGTPLPKMRLDGELGNSVMTILTEIFFAPNGGEYFVRARYEGGRNVIDCIPPGHTEVVYIATPDVVSAFGDKQSTKDLVTQVHLLGHLGSTKDVGVPAESEDADNAATRGRIDHVVSSDLAASWGRRRRLVKGQENDTIEKLKAEGDRILARNGAPQRTRTVTLPDIPYLRKGDKLSISVGTVNGEFFVTGVSHDADNRTMRIIYDSSGTFEHRNYRGESDDSETRDVGVPSENEPGYDPSRPMNAPAPKVATASQSTGEFRSDDTRLLTDVAIARLALGAGLPRDKLQVAVAVCLAESTGFPGAVNTNPPGGEAGGSRDRGLWQINSYWHPDVTDECAFNTQCNAKAMARISRGGTAWSAWAAYTNGSYRQFLPRAQAAVEAL